MAASHFYDWFRIIYNVLLNTLCPLYIHYVFFLKSFEAAAIWLLLRGLFLSQLKDDSKHPPPQGRVGY